MTADDASGHDLSAVAMAKAVARERARNKKPETKRG
jgi:hypothetical protein